MTYADWKAAQTVLSPRGEYKVGPEAYEKWKAGQ